jgi:two-component system cell cycle response regulator DivK
MIARQRPDTGKGKSVQGDGHARPLILIVEDDLETRQGYVEALQLHGFRTEDAHNGYQALEKAFAATPDLIVADIAVPGIDGIELCRRLRADIRTREVPVLAVTGYEDRRYHDRAILAGANRVLTKPCELETLIREIHELVSHRRVQSDAPVEPV